MVEILKIQYRWFLYTDDTGNQWAVNLRKRNGVIGNFIDPVPGHFPKSGGGIYVWGWQNLDMRHVRIKTEDRKLLSIPCASVDSDTFNSVGSVIEFPRWDHGIDDGGVPSETIIGTIISRHGESVRVGPYTSVFDRGTPS